MTSVPTTPEHARDRRRHRIALAVLAASLIAAVAQAIVAEIVDFWMTVAWSAGAATLSWMACRRHTGKARHAWILIALAMSFNAIGDAVFDIYDLMGSFPTISWADPFYLATYPFILIGMAWWVTIRARSSISEIFIDASAVAIVAGLAIWQAFVVTPGILVSGTLVERFVFAAYPMGDVLLVAALMAALFSAARRHVDILLMTGFAVALLIADVMYSTVQVISVPAIVERVANGGYYVAYGLLAASALLQPVTTSDQASDGNARRRPISYLRFALLGMALCGAPVFAIGSVALGYEIHAPVYIGAAISVCAMVMFRFGGMVRRLEVEQRRLGDAEARLVHQASHDALTGLPNRTMLTERLAAEIAAARSHDSQLALMFIDLDGFKAINDSLGHQTGDMLLTAVGVRIRSAIRPDDLVARIGGDEFLVVAPDLHDDAEAVAIAERIMRSLQEPLAVGDNMMQPASSIGVAMLRDSDDAEQLIAHADLALYEAKAVGGTTTRVFDPAMRDLVDRRTAIASGLREALENGTLMVVYQPRRSLSADRVTSVEALVRWPDHPHVTIPEMIDVAEVTNQIERLGRFVLDRACGDIAALNAALREPIGVAVNVSMRQLLRQDLVGDVRGVIERHRLAPEHLTLELTETSLADEPEVAEATLHRVRQMGVRIEIDDFGQGYSSLARLNSLPFDGLKIDRRFITDLGVDPSAQPMVEAIIALAAAVNVDTTAEGIETEGQRVILRDLGCGQGQGFYLGRPMPLAELAAMLEVNSVPAG